MTAAWLPRRWPWRRRRRLPLTAVLVAGICKGMMSIDEARREVGKDPWGVPPTRWQRLRARLARWIAP